MSTFSRNVRDGMYWLNITSDSKKAPPNISNTSCWCMLIISDVWLFYLWHITHIPCMHRLKDEYEFQLPPNIHERGKKYFYLKL